MISDDSKTNEKNNFPPSDHHDMSFRNSWNSDVFFFFSSFTKNNKFNILLFRI